jgi:hypothetical protein
LLRTHALNNRVAFGINHEMADFVTGRRKNLDLVVCTPRSGLPSGHEITFGGLVGSYDIGLTSSELRELNALPRLQLRPVGDVLLALEAKACMTAHVKAAPRLFDELSSASQCINGGAPNAIAVGCVLINTSPMFLSSDRNKRAPSETGRVFSHDAQPTSYQKALETARRLTVRGFATEHGFDAIGVTMLSGVNDGTPYALAPSPPALVSSDPLNYERMIHRVSGLYDSRFLNR